jgi:hypothetical protein
VCRLFQFLAPVHRQRFLEVMRAAA